MINNMIIEFLGQAPADYEWLEYVFSGFVLLFLIGIILGFILVIIYGFISFFKGGGGSI